jgi:hypothetical protein
MNLVHFKLNMWSIAGGVVDQLRDTVAALSAENRSLTDKVRQQRLHFICIAYGRLFVNTA